MRILFICLLLITGSASGQVKWEPEVKQALAKAKAAGKLLFVEAYLPTCPACQAMEPHFTSKEVADKYNSAFVNFKMDVSKNDGPRKFLDERKIYLPSFPQFLFFDGDGNLVHQGETGPNPSSILAVADDAINPELRSSNFKKRFENGDRSLNFLVKYGVYTRLMMDTTGNQKVADEIFNVFPKDQLSDETSWAVTKKVVTSVDNGFFKYWIENIPRAAELEKKAGHAGQEVQSLGGIVQSSLFSKETRSYSSEKLGLMRGYMGKVGAGQYADTYLWEHETLASLREGKKEQALGIGKKMAQKFGQNGPSLIYISKVFNDHYPDASYLSLAGDWLRLSKPLLKENNYLAEYHYEMARVNRKENKIEEARKNADEGLKYATQAKLDLKKYQELISSL